jgi:hypothetical protein
MTRGRGHRPYKPPQLLTGHANGDPEATQTGLPVSTASGVWEIKRAREIKRAWEIEPRSSRKHTQTSPPRPILPPALAAASGISSARAPQSEKSRTRNWKLPVTACRVERDVND